MATNDAGVARGRDRSFVTLRNPQGITASALAQPRALERLDHGQREGQRAGRRRHHRRARAPGLPLRPGPFYLVATKAAASNGSFSFKVGPLWAMARLRLTTRTTIVAASPIVEVRNALRVGLRARRISGGRVRLQGVGQPGGAQRPRHAAEALAQRSLGSAAPRRRPPAGRRALALPLHRPAPGHLPRGRAPARPLRPRAGREPRGHAAPLSSSARSRRSPASGRWIDARTQAPSPSGPPGATITPWRSSRRASSPPSIPSRAQPEHVGLAGRDVQPEVAHGVAVSRVRSAATIAARARHHAAGVAQRLERAGLGELVEPELGLELLEQRLGAGPPDRVAHAQAGQAPGLGEGAEHQQARELVDERQRGVALLGVDEVAQRLVEQHDDALGQRGRAASAARRRATSSPVGSLGLHSATIRVRSLTARRTACAPKPGTGTAWPRARCAMTGYRPYDGHGVTSSSSGSSSACAAAPSS